MLRHPRGVDLGAWFDGEGAGTVGAHVVGCARCQRRVSEMARVRAWVRAQPFFAMGDGVAEPVADRPRRWRPAVVPALAVLMLAVLVPNRPWQSPRGPMDSASRVGGERSHEAGPGPGAAQRPGGPAAPTPPAADQPATPGRAAGDAGPVESASPGNGVLRLGLVVPTVGRLAREGAEIREVVRRRIELANASGGVGGRPVELVTVASEDHAGVAGLRHRVDALVGGFGAAPPDGVPWLLPADPSITGPQVLPVEASPWWAGVQLGTVLRDQGLRGPVGVVVGSGPESALADGLANRVAVTTVPSPPDGSCQAPVDSLRRAGASALAVAGPPDLAARCLEAAGRALWHPRFGAVVPPSAAYTSPALLPQLGGSRTVLALPWPTWTAPGAARFRASTRSASYRALVSFAAAELAIDVARQRGGISLPAIASGTWRSDLVDLVGTTSRPGSVVVADLGSWVQAPPLPALPDLPLGPAAPAGLLPR